MGHLWLFSPPFFVLVWEVKRIVQISVKEVAVRFRQWRSSFDLSLYFSYQSFGLTKGKFHEFS